MEITNKTGKPVTVPLPGGKKLFLGPMKSGQISDKATDHPPLQALVEAGTVELVDAHTQQHGGGAGGVDPNRSAGPGAAGGAAPRRSGDR